MRKKIKLSKAERRIQRMNNWINGHSHEQLFVGFVVFVIAFYLYFFGVL